MPLLKKEPNNNKFIVHWHYNGKRYEASYPTMIQAMLHLWRVGGINEWNGISVKD